MIRDLLWALLWLRRNPMFTVAIIAILALGIGANTAVFSIVDAVLLRPLPYESSARLAGIQAKSTKNPTVGISGREYLLWRDHMDAFETTVSCLKDVVTLTGAGEPDQVTALRASAGLFSLLGARARLGRTLVDTDHAPNAPNAAVLSDRLWRRRFHADPGAIGRTVTGSGEVFTIVGVMPPEFEFLVSNIEMWIPLRLHPASNNFVQVLGRLKEGISLAQAQGAMDVVARQLEQQDPQKNAGLKLLLSPWRETVERQYQVTLVLILVAVGLVLMIACADVGSLLLSRAVQRQKEIAIRASLGAGFWRVVRQLLAESCVLAVLGSVTGMVAAHYVLQYLTRQVAALPIVLPHLQRVTLSGRVLLFNAVLCLLLACICSLAPILLASRTDLQAVLRSGQGARARSSARLFSILIASEAAFAFLLLVGSGLMIRSLIRLQQADHGFRPDHVLTMRVPVGTLTQPRPSGKYETKPLQMAYYRELVQRLERIPGVTAVAVVNNLPLSGSNTSTALQGPDGNPMGNTTRTISPQYFAAMGIPLVRGRVFSDADQAGAPEVAIINEYLARQLFPDRDALGQSLAIPGSPLRQTVVGVVKDSSQMKYDEAAKGEVYRPYRQFIFGTFLSTIVVRTSGEPLSLAATLRQEFGRWIRTNQSSRCKR